MDPLEFLIDHAPFCDLTAEGRRELARRLEISWARAGEKLFSRRSDNELLWVVRKGTVRLELDGQRVDELGPGDLFGIGATTGKPARFDAVAAADCLLYRLPGQAVRTLFENEPAFARFFLDQLSERLRALTDSGPVSLLGNLGAPVEELCRRASVMVDIEATVGDAARLMERERVGCLLVLEGPGPDGPPAGILTDRDLRGRVLAMDRGPETPVGDIMSAPVTTVPAETPSSEALLLLLRRGVHHLPVERNGEVIGVLTHSDLVGHHRHSPGALYKKIVKASSGASLTSFADDIAAMVETLHRSRLEGAEIGRLVAALGDALTSRLLSDAERDLGPPPCPWAWIVHGSEGRQEQSLLTDQDNALIYAEDTSEAESYFGALSERLVGDLVAVGIPLCAGGFMATNWHRPLETWTRLFRGWIEEPEPEAMLEAANFFDFRALCGSLDLEPLEAVVRAASRRRLFLAQLTRAAMGMRPPLGMLHQIRESPEGIDLKAGALMPIVGLARIFSLEASDRHGSTLHRLQTARQAGTLSADGAELLTEAFRFAFDLRLRHQLRERAAGREIDNRIHLDELSPGERRHLREAFIAIDRLQTATAERFSAHRLG